MSESVAGTAETTPILGTPLLTESEKQALFEQPGHGITPATQIRRFATIEEWLQYGGAINNFWQHFTDMMAGVHREPQCMQRFSILYPELDSELQAAATKVMEDPTYRFDQSTEQKFFDAYHKLADLVDVNDMGISDKSGEIPTDLLLA